MLSDEAVIRRLAEMRGWRSCPDHPGAGSPCYVTHEDELGRKCIWRGKDWDPLESISDARECMLALPEEKRDEFIRQLLRPMGLAMLDFSAAWSAVSATPRQLSMAIYAALEGKRANEIRLKC